MIIVKDIPEMNGRYSVSNSGEIINNRTQHILKACTDRDGYKYVFINAYPGKKHQKSRFIHRLVAVSFIDNMENKSTVNHIDGDKSNNDVSNLEWATMQEQTLHAIDLGLREVNYIKK